MKWVKRYKSSGISGLKDLPRNPKRIPNKLTDIEEKNIVELRKLSGFGARRLYEKCVSGVIMVLKIVLNHLLRI